ncbi:MAG: SusC/RagA family TonB-linked outer membrane protein [Gemmatimonadota bacterium]|nr:SusC/RagA family TonB-linked outer membrane protein [Gemmatimonadota bacterium]
MSPRLTCVSPYTLPLLSAAALALSPGRAAAEGANFALAPHVAAAPAATLQQASTGSIRGRVVDESGAPAVSVQVAIVGTQQGAITGNTGEYVIRGVRPGTVSVRAARIGYAPRTQTVTVASGGEATADFTLERVAARLEEVITTATGEQSRRQFGNVVATVNVDSVTSKMPVTNVHEVLQARTAGVQVIQGWGMTGSSPSIRIRGTSSLSLTNEPLIVVDGMRFDNSANPSNFTTGRLNLLSTFNPDEVESIDIIKGPSAAALYGTAAANGVIIIKTKRGLPGSPRWSAYVEGGTVANPGGHTPNYWSWGRNLDANGNPIPNPATQPDRPCRMFNFAANRCVVDSLTTYNPWTAPETDPFRTAPRAMAGLQVTGGSERLRYFLSAEHERETGPYHMPGFEVNRITQARGKAPRAREVDPNQLYMNSLRGNFTVGIRPDLTLDVSTGYLRRTLWTPFEGSFFAGMSFQYYTGPGYKNAQNGLQREFVGDVFGVQNYLRDDRFLGTTSLNWQPRTWLSTRAVVGIDQNNSFGYRQQLRGEGTAVGVAWGPTAQEGGKDYDRSNNAQYTVDLGATATNSLQTDLTLRSSLGAQWFFNATYQSQGRGYGLPPGAETPNAARLRESWEFTTERKTYGFYLEEQVGWRERLFVTAGARLDQHSAFGREATNTVYPRGAVSYVISEESFFPRMDWLGRLRLRAAVGQAGVEPTSIAALRFLGARAYPAGTAADEPGLRLAAIGNEKLKPEVTTEIEGGLDLALFGERVNFEATIFRKISRDALLQSPLPPSWGTAEGAAAPTRWLNVAKVENRGVELTIDAQVLQTAPFSWNMRLNGSTLKNELVDTGTVSLSTAPGARNVQGYPLFGLWDRRITGWNDADGNGILSDAEITVTDAQEFKGSTLPELEAGFSNTFGLLSNALQITALFDYRGKFYKRWRSEEWRCQTSLNCRAANDPTTPLADQAAAVAANSATKRTLWGYFVPNDFIKFRELSVSYAVPDRFVGRYLRGRTATLILSGRNLGYPWTKYPGLDPETNWVVANTGGDNQDLTAQPPMRYFLARVNLGF